MKTHLHIYNHYYMMITSRLIICTPGETSGGSKLTKRYADCLEEHRTLASHNQ